MSTSKSKIVTYGTLILLLSFIGIHQFTRMRHQQALEARQNDRTYLRSVLDTERLRRGDRPPTEVDALDLAALIARAEESFDAGDLQALGDIVRQIGRLPSEELRQLLLTIESLDLPHELRRILDESALAMLVSEDPVFAIEQAMVREMMPQASNWIKAWARGAPQESMDWYNERNAAHPDEDLTTLLKGIVAAVAEIDLQSAKEILAQVEKDDALAAVLGIGDQMAKSSDSENRNDYFELAQGLTSSPHRRRALVHFGLMLATFEQATEYLENLPESLSPDERNDVMARVIGKDLNDNDVNERKLRWITENSDAAFLSDNISRFTLSAALNDQGFAPSEDWLKSIGDARDRDRAVEVFATALSHARNHRQAFAWARKIHDDQGRSQAMKQAYFHWVDDDASAAERHLRSLGMDARDLSDDGIH